MLNVDVSQLVDIEVHKYNLDTSQSYVYLLGIFVINDGLPINLVKP
jgi:hypothetical protein